MSLASPDQHAAGFLSEIPDPLRYDGHTKEPTESAGMVAGLVPRGARVLDVGCGTGSVSKIIVEVSGAELTGIEPDIERTAVAKSRGINAIPAFFNEQAIQSLGKFDVVIFADVLEHLPDPNAALQLAHQVLKPNGLVIASVPNVAHWSVRLGLLFGRFEYRSYGIMDATHLRWFTENSLRNLFERAGYQPLSIQATAGVLLQAYQEYFIWRNFRPRRFRLPLIRFLARKMPRLFGCQHIICAQSLESARQSAKTI